ncbi:MAG: carbon starvation protein A [Verrucomicrobiota bacterium]
MEVLLIALLSGLGFVIAYNTYGQWLGKKIFRLSADAICPSEKFRDDVDYVPTSKAVVFGHHFTSIAGTGPIVGPAIAIMWGWLPALLWVLLGSIFIGAVHDFGALVVSLRHSGRSVGDVAGDLLNTRVRLLFLLVLFVALMIVLAIFGLVIASVFKMYPSAIFPCMVQIPLSIAIGYWLHKKGKGLMMPSLIALSLMYLSVVFGDFSILGQFNEALAAWPLWLWVVVLLAYSYLASVLPVWLLLQPRDFINSLQLVSAIVLIIIGLAAAALIGGASIGNEPRTELSMAAPIINMNPHGAPAIMPFLFITIACGAISGFHCMVSSGTSSKQLKSEKDAKMVGYGAMLTEAFFATLVLLACAAGLGLGVIGENNQLLTGKEAWLDHYSSWSSAGGLGAKIGAFVEGSSNFIKALGIPESVTLALMGVLVASFAGTTLDTACRLKRYVVQELGRMASTAWNNSDNNENKSNPIDFLQNKYIATFIAVIFALLLASVPPAGQEWSLETSGKGGLLLWPLFGATNQLLGGLSFIVIIFYLWRRQLPVWFLVLPALFMLIIPFWAMWSQIFSTNEASWQTQNNWLLIAIGLLTLALEIWIIIEAILLFPKVKGKLKENATTAQN